jgi:magnesium chelatase subunit I
LVRELQIPSHRAEITVLEAARALAAADGRQAATSDDVATVAPMALRQRRSEFIRKYCETAQEEEQDIRTVWHNLVKAGG